MNKGSAWLKIYGLDALLLVGGSLWFGFLATKLSFDMSDEGYVLYIAGELSAGKKLYADHELLSYLPGLFYVFKALLHVAHDGITALHQWIAVPLALNVWLAYRTLKPHAGTAAALAAAAALLLFPGAWDRFYIPLLNLALLGCASQFLLSAQARWLGIMAAVTAIALAIRVDAAVCGFALLALCLYVESAQSRWRLLQTCSLWFAAPIAIIAVFFATEGILGAYLEQLLGLGSHLSWRTTTVLKMQPPNLHELLDWSSFAWGYYVSLLIPAALAAAVFMSRKKRDAHWLFMLTVLVWLCLSLPQYLLERPDVQHLSSRFFALLIAAVVTAGHCFKHAMQTTTAYRGYTATLALSIVIAMGIILTSLCIHMPYSFLMAAQTPKSWCLPKLKCFQLNKGQLLARAVPMLIMVANSKAPEEPVAVLPYAPGVAFLMNTSMPGRQSYVLPNSLLRPDAERDYIRSLLQSGTRYVMLDTSFRYTQDQSSALGSYAPTLFRVLQTCFSLTFEFKPWQLLQRNARNCPPP